jgi:hypothetical protein
LELAASYLKTLRIHARRGQFMLPITAKSCVKPQQQQSLNVVLEKR